MLTFKMNFGQSKDDMMTMNLQPSTKDGYLLLVSQDCGNCTTNNALNITNLDSKSSDSINFTIHEGNRLH